MIAVWTIALNTFRESVRDKIIYVLLGLGLVMILVSRAIGWVSYGGQIKIVIDLGLTSIWLFSALISILVGTDLIYKEIEKRTLYTILSKPIDRFQFLLGKYIGLLLTTFLCMSILSGCFLLYLWAINGPFTVALIQALALTFVEMMIITALALLFSSVSTPLLSAGFTMAIFAGGQLTKWIVDMGTTLFSQQPFVGKFLYGIYLVLPNLHNFNIRSETVHKVLSGPGPVLTAGEMFSCTVYGISYALAVFLVALPAFQRRNF